ncbi:uncharacterized protein VICG_00344 [Vittaforma corneae ATCC 50505]|uniref:C2H2-type domain-containing protein n=1 Tax=Vittaforma corneae (strain ATCC 50505) TaxID=993615 RepID=L2GQK8_VITCO|nr:uncharacterized protein VICG_00344 [Vittaforma corneae ATCC 50505]ELA42592.1 hypothetical protein VICG_00344 [Vittaforma corneae ATCC 50505]
MRQYSSLMDKISRETTEPFSVCYGPFELLESDVSTKVNSKAIEVYDFSVVKISLSEKIDFGDESLDSSLKRDDDSSYYSYERDLIASDNSSKFSSGRNFPCPYKDCRKIYTSSYGLKYHMDHGHTAEKNNEKRPYICTIDNCGKTYKNNNGLKYHVLHAHKGHIFNESDYFM